MERPSYRKLPALIELMDEPYRTPCRELYIKEFARFHQARGSTHNHQAWKGGYVDHVEDAMNYAVLFWNADAATGRPMPFTLTEALVAVYLHDLEKPWRFDFVDGVWRNTGLMKDKDGRADFRWRKIAEAGIPLTPRLVNAITYAEGEGKDYRADKRVMNELAGFVHVCDTYSARVRHEYPNTDDPWSGR